MKDEGERIERERNWKIAFWNVAGLGNKDEEFWRGIRELDVMTFLETWMEEKIRKRLPGGYEWGVQYAKKRNKKGRAIGGVLMGIKKELMVEGTRIKVEKEGMIAGWIKQAERWRIMGIYVRKGIENILRRLTQWVEEREDGVKTLVGGEFNARTEREGGRDRSRRKGMGKRKEGETVKG